jgi:hypothetical protein
MGRQIQAGKNLDSLIGTLASRDGMARLRARKTLVAVGKPATLSLIRALRNSKADQVRWEAAKALNAIGDARAAPALVRALEDKNRDVAWLAAEALRNLKTAAWPVLFRTLIKRGARSAWLRQGAHHVLRNQREEGFNDVLALLLKALDDTTIPETTMVAAYEILERMKKRAEEDANGRRGVTLTDGKPQRAGPSPRSSSSPSAKSACRSGMMRA